MKRVIFLLCIVFSTTLIAQIKGQVTDQNNISIPSASVLIVNTYNNTTTNDKGFYELSLEKTGKYNIVFKYLGYKTKIVSVDAAKFPFVLNVKLEEENFTLNEVVISSKEDPAYKVIRKAIKNRKENSEKTARFKADFYSRGIFKMKNAPKKILGQEIGDLDGSLDSTGTGIIYLSETVSKITFQKPDQLKERIIASKVSGRDNGFSFNTAMSTAYDFYDNTIDFNVKMISPIANNALNYYKYKLESTFQDENNQTINKIKVIPRRDSEPVFEGYIYIVEDSWAIYAIDLDIKGYRMHQEFLDILNLKQNFSYNKSKQIWSKNSQNIDFNAGAFGIKFNGKFSYVYSNYEFAEVFEKNIFTNEIVSFENNSNKKDTLFWNKSRPIPLTEEENTDYIKKDSIFKKRNSIEYLDSIDRKNNKFKIQKLLSGYSYKNSFKKETFAYEGLMNLSSLSFNTVQGWNFDSGFSYSNEKEEEITGKRTNISTKFNYGFADKRLRVSAEYKHRFNSQNYANIIISGGTKVSQINDNEPVSKIVNSIATLYFKENYMKLYNKEFVGIAFGQNVANGIYMNSKLEYEQRKPLFNTTDYVTIKRDRDYLSNNPLLPNNDAIPSFEQHHITKWTVGARINFGNKYITRPDGKINLPNDKYPTINIGLENAFGSNRNQYDYQLVNTKLYYELPLSNKGSIKFNLKAGKFFNADNISIIDYKHFNGNQTFIGGDYINSFGLLPYYTNSTNKSYSENHFEYDDSGYIMNKIPLLNLLKTNLIIGYKNLFVPNTKPYSEFSVGLNNLGFGKFKILRLDYIQSYQNGIRNDGFTVGLKF